VRKLVSFEWVVVMLRQRGGVTCRPYATYMACTTQVECRHVTSLGWHVMPPIILQRMPAEGCSQGSARQHVFARVHDRLLKTPQTDQPTSAHGRICQLELLAHAHVHLPVNWRSSGSWVRPTESCVGSPSQ
jgi:hypothetical protein